jgi:hypothetical protein
MTQKLSDALARRPSGRDVDLTTRLETVRYLSEIHSRRRTIPVQAIADALVQAGYISLDEQAKALGLHRATTWTIIGAKHKLGRLNSKTTDRLLANHGLPPSVRAVLENYVAERS